MVFLIIARSLIYIDEYDKITLRLIIISIYVIVAL